MSLKNLCPLSGSCHHSHFHLQNQLFCLHQLAIICKRNHYKWTITVCDPKAFEKQSRVGGSEQQTLLQFLPLSYQAQDKEHSLQGQTQSVWASFTIASCYTLSVSAWLSFFVSAVHVGVSVLVLHLGDGLLWFSSLQYHLWCQEKGE